MEREPKHTHIASHEVAYTHTHTHRAIPYVLERGRVNGLYLQQHSGAETAPIPAHSSFDNF